MKSNQYPDNKGKYSVFAHGPNVPTLIIIGSTCNNGQTELTIQYLKSLGYTSVVIVTR